MLAASTAAAQEESSEPTGGPEEEESRSVLRLGDVVGGGEDEFSMDVPVLDAPPAGERPDVSLPDPERNARLQRLLDQRAAGRESAEVAEAFDVLLVEIREAGLQSLAAGDLVGARARQAALAVLAPEAGISDEIAAWISARDRVARLSDQLDQAIAQDRLLVPADDSAAWYLEQLRQSAPNPTTDTGEAGERLAAALRARFDEFLAAEQLVEASDWLAAVDGAPDLGLDLPDWRQALRAARVERIDNLEQEARRALRARNVAAARSALEQLVAFGAEDSIMRPLQADLRRLQRYGDFAPGQRFSDRLAAGRGPMMIVVPAGSARLGSPPGEPGRFGDEGPVFTVEIERGFALSETEITVGQFRRFVQATDYRTDAERTGSSNVFDERGSQIIEQRFVDWQQDYLGNRAGDDLPVVHVSFNDARAFAEWLASATGEPYRLPSEAEFEYALRAGTVTRFWWGSDSPANETENVAGDRDRLGRDLRWSDAFDNYRDGYWGPAPTGSLRPNPFGLFDLGGNVLEWTADCWINDYNDPPIEGSARTRGDCGRRVLRGGAWSNGPSSSRSAYRLSGTAGFSDARVGFRVARDLVAPDDVTAPVAPEE
jgi:formylglycine-generating enzyme required for sulfatase activity